jgi:hypothetical protein
MDFCAALRPAGEKTVAAAPEPGAASDLADGYIQLGGLLECALRWYLRGSDPDFPRFVEINDTPEIADNLFAAIRGDASYVISGDSSSSFDFNVSVHTNWGWLGPSTVSGDLGRRELQIHDDGRFTLTLSGQECQGNWLRLPSNAAYVQIREYHADYSPARPGVFDIRRVDAPSAPPSRNAPPDIAERLKKAANWAQQYVDYHRQAQQRIFPGCPNTLYQPASQQGGNRNILYGFGRFALQGSEALIVSFDKPSARLWNIQWLLPTLV